LHHSYEKYNGKIEVKNFRMKKGGAACADVTSFFPHNSRTTLTRDCSQASRVACHLANHNADTATYVTGQLKGLLSTIL